MTFGTLDVVGIEPSFLNATVHTVVPVLPPNENDRWGTDELRSER